MIDSGINPYHLDFRRRELTAHPSTYIEGYPRSSKSLDITFDAKTQPLAYKADRKKWKAVKPNRLYWIPGTNVIGAIGPFDRSKVLDQDANLASDGDANPPAPFYDDRIGHGTAVASLAGGSIHGPGSDDIVIVAMTGFQDAVRWAAKQPWIDVITNSWWYPVRSLDVKKAAHASRKAVEKGKVVCFASGNYSHPIWYSSTQGPSWNVNVGAASARTRGEHYYSDYPNDILGLAGVPAARSRSYTGVDENFAGTSAAAPNVCGLIAKTISRVREELGYFREGTVRGALALGRGEGALADGRLTNDELEDAIQSTAVPALASAPDPEDEYSIPASPVAPFVRGGYGIVDGDSAVDALKVLLGIMERPDRSLEDAWLSTTDSLRDAIWGPRP